VRDHVLHPYKTTDRIMGMYILTFAFLDRRQEEIGLLTEWKQAFPEFRLLLISSCMKF
jgi:hypothetical protein